MHPRHITVSDLAKRYGPSKRWWRDHASDLVAAGLLVKVGQSWFGDYAEIDAWLMGRSQQRPG